MFLYYLYIRLVFLYWSISICCLCVAQATYGNISVQKCAIVTYRTKATYLLTRQPKRLIFETFLLIWPTLCISLLYCKKCATWQVAREGKWRIDKTEWRYTYWPTFCQGIAFIMSINFVTSANRLVHHVPHIWLDDVSTTALTRSCNKRL